VAALVVRRVLETLPTLALLSVLAFALLESAPGDPARRLLTQGGQASSEIDERDVAALRYELGLDLPLWQRYLRWAGGVARLDFGTSYVNRRRVTDLVAERLPASVALAALALAVGVGLSVPLGIAAAVRHRTALDGAIRAMTLLGGSLPAFWLALLLIWLFAAELHLFPALGSLTPAGIVLPAAVLAWRTTGLLTRLTRAALLDALGLEHIRVARAKGLGERTIVLRHALSNALVPITTVIALDLAALIAHATIVEWVFDWPGLGRMGVEAALAGDVPVLLAYVLVACVVVVAINLAADIAVLAIDPRQRTTL